jgi:DnaJ-class molecular chaperone
MRGPKPTEAETEVICPACDGTGFARVEQPAQPGRKIYPPRCKQCSGKGRVPQ